MQIPRRVDYGFRAVIYLSVRGRQKYCSITEIATQQEVPKKFLAKIIQDLMRCDLIKSKRGPRGGYTLARSPEKISLSDVIETIVGGHRRQRLGCCNRHSGDSNKQLPSQRETMKQPKAADAIFNS
jgi:Rrf2 family protein